jgi:hypothetical protein
MTSPSHPDVRLLDIALTPSDVPLAFAVSFRSIERA